MSELFCNQCHSTAEPGYRLNIILNIVGTVFAGLALLFLFAPAFFLVAICGGISALSFWGSYNARSFFCGMCGSPEVIPAGSPRAREFALRHQAFEHIDDRLQSVPEAVEQPPEINITPNPPQADDGGRLSAFREDILRRASDS